MKTITINLPESYLEAIEKLITTYKLHPNRSELTRIAIREFLKEHLETIKHEPKPPQKLELEEDDFDDEHFVRVPIDKETNTFKTYRIVRRLV